SANCGCARAIIACSLSYALPLRERMPNAEGVRRVRGILQATPHPAARFARVHPLPQGERVFEYVAPSSRRLPGGAVLGILEHDAQRGEFIANTIGLGEVSGPAGREPRGNTPVDFLGRQGRSWRTGLAP